jgi:hypothetical protein
VSAARAATLACLAVLCAVAVLGCGGVTAGDLFVVTRSGPAPVSRLTLLVNEEGNVHCNGGPTRKISDPQLVLARAIAEETHDQTSAHTTLPARPGSVFGYSLRTESGTVTFADNSAKLPSILRELMGFVLQVSQQVCHLPD